MCGVCVLVDSLTFSLAMEMQDCVPHRRRAEGRLGSERSPSPPWLGIPLSSEKKSSGARQAPVNPMIVRPWARHCEPSERTLPGDNGRVHNDDEDTHLGSDLRASTSPAVATTLWVGSYFPNALMRN